MKNHKLSLLAILALGGLIISAPLSQAQDTNAPATTPGGPGRPARGAQAALQAALDKLDLSADQKAKVAAAVKDQRQKTTDLRADTSLSPADRRAKRKEITDAFDASMKTILTADQYKKWLEVRPPQPGGRRNAGGAGAAAGGGAAGGATTPQN